MPGIFISYRRDDSAGHAGRLFDRLEQHFGAGRVFMDVAALEPGTNFYRALNAAIGSCEVLIAVIGKEWLAAADSRGRRRLDDPRDTLRIEIATALASNRVRVVPVLVEGAQMPAEQWLPDDLKRLAYLHAFELRDGHWNSDVRDLIARLERAMRRGGVRFAAPAGPQASGPPDDARRKRLPLALALLALLLIVIGVAKLFVPEADRTVPTPDPQQVRAEVPALVGLSAADAKRRLAEAGLATGRIDERTSDARPGAVVEQDPAAGSKVEPGHEVRLVVAARPPAEMTEVPKLVGATLREARALARSAQLKLGRIVERESDAPSGTVLEQRPAAGESVEPGRAVDLVVAKAPKPAEPPGIVVRDVKGLTRKEAEQALARQGLASRASHADVAGGVPGRVVAQKPAAGETVKPGSEVEIVVASRAPDPQPASALPRPGDTWTYRYSSGWSHVPPRTVVHRVLAASADRVRESIVADGAGADVRTFGAKPEIVERRSGEWAFEEFAPFLVAFQELRPGMGWSRIPAPVGNPLLGDWQVSARVAGSERVSVPAGIFDAIRVQVRGQRPFTGTPTSARQDVVRFNHEIWYAPAVKRVVKSTRNSYSAAGTPSDRDSYELIEYRVQ